MDNLKITIDQLKNYLGTGLKIEPDGKSAAEKNILVGLYQDPCLSVDAVYFGTIDGQDIRTIDGMRPICHRLSDLDKFIPELGFVPLQKLTPYAKTRFEFVRDLNEDVRDWTFQDMQKLFQWHFWPFGEEYFEEGLVIDKLKQQ